MSSDPQRCGALSYALSGNTGTHHHTASGTVTIIATNPSTETIVNAPSRAVCMSNAAEVPFRLSSISELPVFQGGLRLQGQAASIPGQFQG